MIRLSICIATFKRADTIAQTLASIEPQLTPDVEVVVLDGGSPDETTAVVAPFAARQPTLRYVREPTNSGIDADFDKAVQYARGEYVWLFTDDDLLAPDAVACVLAEIARSKPNLIVVDAQVCDLDVARIFEPRRLPFSGRREYDADQRDAFMRDAGNALSFIGGTIIRRDLWLARERKRFYGSLFIHVGVIFQKPLDRIVVLGQPLVSIRIGNAMWGRRAFEIWLFMWPELIWSFDGYSDEAKAQVVDREPWRRSLELLNYRALASFEKSHLPRLTQAGASARLQTYARFLLWLPGWLTHIAMTARIAIGSIGRGSHAYTLIVASPFSNPISRAIARLNGHRVKRGRAT